MACTIIVSAGASQALVGRFGVRNVLLVGLALLTLGLLFFTRVSPHGTYLGDLAPGFVLAGVGLGFAFIPVTIAALMGISDDEAGLASGLINTSQQIGGAVGVALLATVFTSRTAELRASGTAADVAFTDGLSRAFLVGALMAVLGLAATLVLIRGGSPETEPAAAEASVASGAQRSLKRSAAAALWGGAAAAAGRRLRGGVASRTCSPVALLTRRRRG